jgi:hypothetical protein
MLQSAVAEDGSIIVKQQFSSIEKEIFKSR